MALKMMTNECQKAERKKNDPVCTLKKKRAFSPARDLCVLISKCVPKEVYMREKRQKTKKKEKCT